MASIFHIDTDVLVYAVSVRGPERKRVAALLDSDALVEASALVWYEFSRGPRTPEQLAVARAIFDDDGIVALSESVAAAAADEFRRLGSPRKRAADIAIGVAAVERNATLLTRNARDFAGIRGLRVERIA